jgi:TonB family protein
VPGGENFLSNEAHFRRLAQRRFWIAFGVSAVLHAAVLGWPRPAGNLKGASEFQAGTISGGLFEVRLVSPAQSALQAVAPQRLDDTAQSVSVVPVPGIRQGGKDATGESGGLLPAEPVEPNPVIPGFPDVRYYTKRELSKEPALATTVNLDVPRGATAPEGGKVALRLWIGESGRVDIIVVVGTNVPVIMTEAAVAAFKAARFQPGEINGEAVKSQLAIAVSYEVDAPPKTLRLADPPSPRVR